MERPPSLLLPWACDRSSYRNRQRRGFLSRARFIPLTNELGCSWSKSKKAGVQVVEERESVYPRYITQLLTEILRGMGAPAEVTHIRKWIAGDVLWDNALKPSETLSHVAPHSRGATNFAIPRDQNSYRIQDIHGVLYGSVAAVSIIDRASEQYTLLPESESRQQTL